MCTAATYQTKDFYMGRTLDYEFSYGEQIAIIPIIYRGSRLPSAVLFPYSLSSSHISIQRNTHYMPTPQAFSAHSGCLIYPLLSICFSERTAES